MLFYTKFPYSPKATAVSFISSLLSLFCVILGVAAAGSAYNGKEPVEYLYALLFFAAAILLFIFCSRKLARKIAEKDGNKNIRTKAKYGRLYVLSHPNDYDWMVRENPAFAPKYVRNEEGIIVKRKA